MVSVCNSRKNGGEMTRPRQVWTNKNQIFLRVMNEGRENTSELSKRIGGDLRELKMKVRSNPREEKSHKHLVEYRKSTYTKSVVMEYFVLFACVFLDLERVDDASHQLGHWGKKAATNSVSNNTKTSKSFTLIQRNQLRSRSSREK